MAATLHDDVLDGALNVVKNNTENLYICSSMPTTFTEASSTYKLGVKASPSFTGPADDTSGRKVTVDAITNGSVTGDGTAGYVALTDDSASKLLAAQALNSSQSVTTGNTFTLTAFKIAIPDPTA